VEMQELRDIIRLLKDEGLSEITIADGDQRITVKRVLSADGSVQGAVSAQAPASDRDADLPANAFHLTAPLVGTFYRRPSPDDEPFVTPGDVVQVGDIICVIEAMKVMNEIKAETPGRVREVLLDDGAVVEFGQPLFVFERP